MVKCNDMESLIEMHFAKQSEIWSFPFSHTVYTVVQPLIVRSLDHGNSLFSGFLKSNGIQLIAIQSSAQSPFDYILPLLAFICLCPLLYHIQVS